MTKKCVIGGGKTGGHLIPGIAIYQEFKSRGWDVKYVLSHYDLRFSIINKIDEKDRIIINFPSISRKISFKSVIDIVELVGIFLRIIIKIAVFNPDVIVITGGYVSNPVALSSIFLFKPLYILEQNSIAGITNRFFSIFARKVFSSFPETLKISKKKLFYTGNPMLFVKKHDKMKARDFFNLHTNIIVGVTSGSQGAKSVNNGIIGLLPLIKEMNLGLIWSIGAVEYERFKKEGLLEIISEIQNIRAFPFIERMDYFYSSIDVLISRAGATTVSEIFYFKVPSILIPIKNSPDNHQFLNASFLEKNGVGVVVEECDSLGEELKKNLEKMISNLPYYRQNFISLDVGEKISPQKTIADYIITSLKK